MPLLVVALSPTEVARLTLHEWDLLRERKRVHFEAGGHPLEERLRAEGCEVRVDPDVDAGDGSAALVLDPASPRIVELARAGADVLAGAGEGPDALTTAHGAYVGRRAAAALHRLALVMARLRGPDGCPWDQEQTHESLRVHLIEEAYEVLEAIDHSSLGPELEEELGDILLQVVFHAQMAADEGRFDLAEVADTLVDKLVYRHPHVFADAAVADAAEVVSNWEALKKKEKKRAGAFDDIPAALPALLLAYKTQKRAAPLGFEATADRSRAEVEARIGGPLDPVGLGDALFWLVALARADGIDPEGALRAAVARFRERYEGLARRGNGPEEMSKPEVDVDTVSDVEGVDQG